MWGTGGKYYWGRRKRERKKKEGADREGVVVAFTWSPSTSIDDCHVSSFVELYSSLGWDSLVCHSHYLNLFFPEKAEALAFNVLNNLLMELKIRPCPVVFASFSGGTKACMYKVLQILEGRCELQLNLDDCQLVKDCLSGHIYDSSPVDFTTELGIRFLSHPPRALSWVANGISNSLDALFINRFESDRADYWRSLYFSVSLGAPYLIVCSESDSLAPYQVICNFARRVQELGGDIKLLALNGSSHLGHYGHYPIDYKAAVTELLGKAAAVYSQRIRRLEGERMTSEGTHEDDLSGPISERSKAAMSPDRSFWGVNIAPSDHFFMPSSVGNNYYEGRDVGSLQDERKEGLIHLPSPPSISAQGVLGQILFDVCVPKNVEDWEPSTPVSKYANASSSRRHGSFNPIKCICRSRL